MDLPASMLGSEKVLSCPTLDHQWDTPCPVWKRIDKYQFIDIFSTLTSDLR
jgi:hypothetical protein